jgi:hypothetical protein
MKGTTTKTPRRRRGVFGWADGTSFEPIKGIWAMEWARWFKMPVMILKQIEWILA